MVFFSYLNQHYDITICDYCFTIVSSVERCGPRASCCRLHWFLKVISIHSNIIIKSIMAIFFINIQVTDFFFKTLLGVIVCNTDDIKQ